MRDMKELVAESSLENRLFKKHALNSLIIMGTKIDFWIDPDLVLADVHRPSGRPCLGETGLCIIVQNPTGCDVKNFFLFSKVLARDQ